MPTPDVVLAAAAAAADDAHSLYAKFEGVDPLRYALAKKAAHYNKITCNPDTDIVVTIGATGALAAVATALFDPGDEVILFEPYYGYHVNTLLVAQVKPVFLTMAPPSWRVDFDAIEAAITPRTRAIIVNTPSNPCGKVWTRAELEKIADICTRRDLIAITDEIYEYIVYDGHTHCSLASLPGMYERTITITGYSKTFSITGWRIGCLIAPPALAGPIGLINDLFYVCAPTPLQHAVAAGIDELPDSYYEEMSADYQRSRDQICSALREAGLEPIDPAGAYYVLADVSSLGFETAREASMAILERAGVASVPGSAFFQSAAGEKLVRFCFAKRPEILDAACERLRGLKG